MTNLHEPDKEPQTPGKFAVSQVSRLSYSEDALQFGELHLPDRPGPHPVAIVIQGGFWRAAYGYTLMTGLSEDLAHRGIAAWHIDYRRVGDRQDGWPNTLLVVAATADYLGSIAPR